MFKQENPKRKNSNTYKRYNVYKSAKDETEYFAIWNKSKKNKIDGFECTSNAKADLAYDMKKGYVILNENKITVADFFCGAGGFSEGFYQAGFDIVFALDNWKPAIDTHDLNHPPPNCISKCINILQLDSPEKIDEVIPDTDIIIGSPPCISFSNSNKSGKADKTLGIKLIEQYLKIILHKKTKQNSVLKYWIMENVPNSLDFVKDEYTAEELGLDKNLPNLLVNNKQILVASDYGSPQGRKRAIAGDYIIPNKTHNKDNVTHINIIMNALGPPLNNNNTTIIDPSFPNLKLKKDDVTDHFYDSEIPNDWAIKSKRLKKDHGYMGKMEFPDKTNRLCRTIMATESYCSRESIIFAKENTDKYRAPTIRELSCLMGFPIDYQFVGKNTTSKHKQIGNAVCVHLSFALANAIKKDMNIQLCVSKRKLNKASINLNELKEPVFSNYYSKPKKLSSKFHIHVPYLKINQLRVELDNMSSDFENSKFIWSCSIHKGSGKQAIKTQYNNPKFINLINNHNKYNDMIKFIDSIKPKVYNSLIFQEKNCDIPNQQEHYSPYELLELISTTIKGFKIDNDTVEINELDEIFQYKKKPNKYPLEVIFSLYILNSVVELLV